MSLDYSCPVCESRLLPHQWEEELKLMRRWRGYDALKREVLDRESLRCEHNREVYHRAIQKAPEMVAETLADPDYVEDFIEDAGFFSYTALPYHPAGYQADLLRDYSKRVAVRFCRQAGKTLTLGVKLIWFCLYGHVKYGFEPPVTALIVSPSQRQSTIFRDKIDRYVRFAQKLGVVRNSMRQTVYFENGSKVVALPNSPDRIRGETAHFVVVDEAAMIPDCDYLVDNVIEPMFATTDGVLTLASTPKGSQSYFWRACKGDLADYYSQHHVTFEDAWREGIYRDSFAERKLEQLEEGTLSQQQFDMEYKAQFVDEVDSWLPYDLIARCIDTERDWTYLDWDARPKGRFYAGLDLGQRRDHSDLIILQREGGHLSVVFRKRFPLDTPFSSVIGACKRLDDRYRTITRWLVDETGHAYVVEDMEKSGIRGVEGVRFTLDRKEEWATYLKQHMKRTCDCHPPRGDERGKPVLEIPYDEDLIHQLHNEKYELTKAGKIGFSHESGTHDDAFWALALAVYASREEKRGVVVKL